MVTAYKIWGQSAQKFGWTDRQDRYTTNIILIKDIVYIGWFYYLSTQRFLHPSICTQQTLASLLLHTLLYTHVKLAPVDLHPNDISTHSFAPLVLHPWYSTHIICIHIGLHQKYCTHCLAPIVFYNFTTLGVLIFGLIFLVINT